jgi:hypothetical protein
MDIGKLLEDRTKKVLMIVAHPDDEVLFGGGILSKYSGSNWALVCCCEQQERIPEFLNVASSLNVNAYYLDLPVTEFNKNLSVLDNIHPLYQNLYSYYSGIISFLDSAKADIIITHNKYGEYNNPTHSVVSNIVNLYVNLVAPKTTIFSFATNKDNIVSDADWVLIFDNELYEKKKKLMHLYLGKEGTLLKFNITHCQKEALYYEGY